MVFEDRTLSCKDCTEEFTFTAGEQEFYATKGFENDPSRCQSCRSAKRQQRNGYRANRQMYNVTCDGCGIETEVPFKPTGDKPVYCRTCFQNKR